MSTPNPSYYHGLVLSSGGLKGICQLGALHYYQQRLNDLKFYVGTSIGSLIIYLLCLGYTPVEIFSEFCIHNFDNLFLSYDTISCLKEMGISSFDFVLQELEKLSIAKLEYVPTLLELYEETGKEVYIVTYNLSKHIPEYLSYKNYPDLSCLDAVHMSCNIPIIFKKKIYNNNFYIDGGFADRFPIIFADTINKEKPRILAISTENTHNVKDAENVDLFDYLKELLSVSYYLNKNLTDDLVKAYLSPSHIDVIKINSKISTFPRNKAEKFVLFDEGFCIAKEMNVS